MNDVSVARPYRKRRQYTPEFKVQLVAKSQIPDASVSRVALDNNLNASLFAHPFAGSGSDRKKEQLHPHRNSPSRQPDCSGIASDQQVLSSFQPVGLGQLRHLGFFEIARVGVVDVLNRGPELEAGLANQAILFSVFPGLALPVE